MRKTTLICQNCVTEILKVESCTGLVVICSNCGHEILLNVVSEETVIKTRPPKKQPA